MRKRVKRGRKCWVRGSYTIPRIARILENNTRAKRRVNELGTKTRKNNSCVFFHGSLSIIVTAAERRVDDVRKSPGNGIHLAAMTTGAEGQLRARVLVDFHNFDGLQRIKNE